MNLSNQDLLGGSRFLSCIQACGHSINFVRAAPRFRVKGDVGGVDEDTTVGMRCARADVG
jgi:hypothetical protein